jgi:hypothetical protein
MSELLYPFMVNTFVTKKDGYLPNKVLILIQKRYQLNLSYCYSEKVLLFKV